jgi:acetyl esterase/lipase
MRRFLLLIVLACCLSPLAHAQSALSPRIETVRSEDGASIEAHVFDAGAAQAPRAAVVLFHGGGWSEGDATWVYARARRFAGYGMLAVAVDYRLAGPNGVTPREAVADARAAIAWVRDNAQRLNVDPRRVAAYGVSAGGQLAVSAAQGDDARSRPDLLVLVSPALDLENDAWFVRLMGVPEDVVRLSPLNNVHEGLAPVLILQGDVDTLTPLAGARTFCERVLAAGDACELQVYQGYGHLFTPAGVNDQGMPRPDPTISAAAAARADAFLRAHGFIG